MADKYEYPNDHELMKLLPFYANHTLDEQENLSVEDYLARSDKARQELVFVSRLRDAIKKQPGVNPPGELGLKRLQRDISLNTAAEMSQGSDAGKSASERAVNAQLSARGQGVAFWWRHVAVAACLTLAVFAGLSVESWQGDSNEAQLAGSGNGPSLQVTFKPQATEAAIRSLLLDAGLTIKEGPSSLGIYYLGLESSANGATLKSALRKLQTHQDIVDTAEID